MAALTADPFRAARLLLALRQHGVTDDRVLKAMEIIDRGDFVDPAFADLAFEPCTLPIACGQVALSPHLVGQMLQSLQLEAAGEARVFLVGAGSGYTAALLSRLAAEVVAVERFRALADDTEARLERMGFANVAVHHGNGLGDWGAAGPFHGILLTGMVEAVPDTLKAALAPGGRLVVPLAGPSGGVLQARSQDGLLHERPLRHKLPPLIDAVAKAL